MPTQESSATQQTKHRIGRKVTQKQAVNVLLKWTAPDRIWQPRSKQWYLLSALAILLVIFVFVRQGWYIAILAMIAFMMLWFLQAYREPLEVEHRITNKGIFTANVLFHWENITYFWMATVNDQLLLYLDFSKESNQPRITMLVPPELEYEIFNILIDYVKYGEPTQVEYTFFSSFIYGEYIPISRYIPDLDQPGEEDFDIYEETSSNEKDSPESAK